MSGDRAWAERCAAWLDGYLAANPTWDNAPKIVWQGWHESGLLEDHKAYPELIAALRIELARRLLNWRSKGGFNPFEKEEKRRMILPSVWIATLLTLLAMTRLRDAQRGGHQMTQGSIARLNAKQNARGLPHARRNNSIGKGLRLVPASPARQPR